MINIDDDPKEIIKELSETEKTYDRNTATETLKLIIALGYEIRKKEQPSE